MRTVVDIKPRYVAPLGAFKRHAGMPVVLNSSCNLEGEAIVDTPRDTLRTSWRTGLDALAIGNCLVTRPVEPARVEPEKVVR